MLIVSTFDTPAGIIEVAHDEHYIFRAVFTDYKDNKAKQPKSFLGDLVANEINAYCNNPHHHFQLPLKPLGSNYQLKVWSALLVIPVGRTLTYGELALSIQSSPRAIGQACKANPLALFIPCHRVVGKNNNGGYMGQASALKYKMALLEHEAS